jgi:hypothetical protein
MAKLLIKALIAMLFTKTIGYYRGKSRSTRIGNIESGILGEHVVLARMLNTGGDIWRGKSIEYK